MKQRIEILIDANLDTVWKAFDNPQNLGRWQQYFHSCTQLSGDAGKVGSVSELRFNEKGKMLVLTETITERRDKHFLAATHESQRGKTTIVNRFEKLDSNITRWTTWHSYAFTGFTRLASSFFPGTIRKRLESDMQRFKLMVETDSAGSAA